MDGQMDGWEKVKKNKWMMDRRKTIKGWNEGRKKTNGKMAGLLNASKLETDGWMHGKEGKKKQTIE